MFDKLLSLFGGGPAVAAINAQELQLQLKAREKPFILDVRTPAEYKGGHIAGSKLIPLDELRQRMDNLPQNRPIVCVCRSGRRSSNACRQLAAAGFANVTNLSGGMMAWQRAHLPVRRR